MSFFGGGRHGRLHDEAASTRRRAEQHLGRDVGDERAFSLEARTRRRVKLWPLWVLGGIFVLGAFGILPGGSSFEVAKDCDQATFAMESYDVTPGESVQVKATGPEDGEYVLVTGPGQVTETPDGPSVSGGDGAVLSDLFEMPGCQVELSVNAPEDIGTHTVRLMHSTAGGDFVEVAGLALTVN